MPAQSRSSHVQRVFDTALKPNSTRLDDRPIIAQSWQRCVRDHHLNPDHAPSSHVLSHSKLKEHQQRMDFLVNVAVSEMEHLYGYMSTSGYSVILADKTGYVMKKFGDPGTDHHLSRADLVEGADWSESAKGTNGVGTCLVENRPITVHFDDHFHTNHTILTCTGMPIRDSQGQMLAVLDTSSATRGQPWDYNQRSFLMQARSVQLIEGQYFLRVHRNDWIIHLSSSPDLVPQPINALVALDTAGRIIGLNEQACQLLGIQNLGSALGQSLGALIDAAPELLKHGPRNTRPLPAFCFNNGSTLYAQGYFNHQFIVPQHYSPKFNNRTSKPVASTTKPALCDEFALTLDKICQHDSRMQTLGNAAIRVFERDIALCIQGETGSGKEVFAQALHQASSLSKAPFVAVNCAAIPETLIESELFGYAQGAFTGARREGMKGRIEQADGGTLFLDEIGDMPLSLQTRLLRVLESKTIQPLGGQDERQIQVRIISATHTDLEQAVERGEFRADLFYRLTGFEVELPALREREDKLQLLDNLVAREAQQQGVHIVLSGAVRALMAKYPWPGNIRQASNVLRTAMALADGDEIELCHLPRALRKWQQNGNTHTAVSSSVATPTPNHMMHQQGVYPGSLPLSPLANAEKDALINALANNNNNISRTAAQLGTSRNTVYRKMRKYGLEQL